MKKRLSRSLALLLAVLALAGLLTACEDRRASPPPDATSPPSSDPEPQPQPDPQPEPEPEPEPEPNPEDEITGQNTVVADGIWHIDTSYFVENSQTIDHIFVCNNDRVLFFASSLNPDGTVAEGVTAYAFSLDTGRFLPNTLDLGVVGLYPDQTYDDGTVSVITLDSESYEYKDILFINPENMAVQSVAAPHGEDIIALSISPNKQYIAISGVDTLRVTDMSYSQPLLQVEAQADENGDQLIPSPTDWSEDSSRLSFKMGAWESLHTPAIADIATGDVRYFPDLTGNELRFAGDSLFYCDWYPYLPCGFTDLDGQNRLDTPLDIISDPSGITPFTISGSGAYLGIASTGDGGGQALICDAHTGQPIMTYTVSSASFDEIYFTPDERTAVFATATNREESKQIYVMDFNR